MNPSSLKAYKSICNAFSGSLMTTHSLWQNSLLGRTTEYGMYQLYPPTTTFIFITSDTPSQQNHLEYPTLIHSRQPIHLLKSRMHSTSA